MGDDRSEILQGTLDLMVLKTLDAMGPMHGYGIALRIEQVAEDALKVNQGTLYLCLVRLVQGTLAVGQLGHLREQPSRAVLHADGGGEAAPAGRDRELGSGGGRDGPTAAAGERLDAPDATPAARARGRPVHRTPARSRPGRRGRAPHPAPGRGARAHRADPRCGAQGGAGGVPGRHAATRVAPRDARRAVARGRSSAICGWPSAP